jgi:hypothetical protein
MLDRDRGAERAELLHRLGNRRAAGLAGRAFLEDRDLHRRRDVIGWKSGLS